MRTKRGRVTCGAELTKFTARNINPFRPRVDTRVSFTGARILTRARLLPIARLRNAQRCRAFCFFRFFTFANGIEPPSFPKGCQPSFEHPKVNTAAPTGVENRHDVVEGGRVIAAAPAAAFAPCSEVELGELVQRRRHVVPVEKLALPLVREVEEAEWGQLEPFHGRVDPLPDRLPPQGRVRRELHYLGLGRAHLSFIWRTRCDAISRRMTCRLVCRLECGWERGIALFVMSNFPPWSVVARPACRHLGVARWCRCPREAEVVVIKRLDRPWSLVSPPFVQRRLARRLARR
mmetsp:Transcript_46891/g.106162  ORF Transcript_46891/g.106162 Transcript_46891/m.106162 type:complete len:291 (+) Transcript_46891:844-1716(+)